MTLSHSRHWNVRVLAVWSRVPSGSDTGTLPVPRWSVLPANAWQWPLTLHWQVTVAAPGHRDQQSPYTRLTPATFKFRCSGRIRVPGHTTRAPPVVGFEQETNRLQFYAIKVANLDKTTDEPENTNLRFHQNAAGALLRSQGAGVLQKHTQAPSKKFFSLSKLEIQVEGEPWTRLGLLTESGNWQRHNRSAPKTWNSVPGTDDLAPDACDHWHF